MGKAGVPPAVACESPRMQARRLLYPLFRSLLRNMSYITMSYKIKNALWNKIKPEGVQSAVLIA